jgi:hypothetical protein
MPSGEVPQVTGSPRRSTLRALPVTFRCGATCGDAPNPWSLRNAEGGAQQARPTSGRRSSGRFTLPSSGTRTRNCCPSSAVGGMRSTTAEVLSLLRAYNSGRPTLHRAQ